jgi:hypothetical protein
MLAAVTTVTAANLLTIAVQGVSPSTTPVVRLHSRDRDASGGPKLAFGLQPVVQIVPLLRPAREVNLKGPTGDFAVRNVLELRVRHNP